MPRGHPQKLRPYMLDTEQPDPDALLDPEQLELAIGDTRALYERLGRESLQAFERLRKLRSLRSPEAARAASAWERRKAEARKPVRKSTL